MFSLRLIYYCALIFTPLLHAYTTSFEIHKNLLTDVPYKHFSLAYKLARDYRQIDLVNTEEEFKQLSDQTHDMAVWACTNYRATTSQEIYFRCKPLHRTLMLPWSSNLPIIFLDYTDIVKAQRINQRSAKKQHDYLFIDFRTALSSALASFKSCGHTIIMLMYANRTSATNFITLKVYKKDTEYKVRLYATTDHAFKDDRHIKKEYSILIKNLIYWLDRIVAYNDI